jgi:hypothetical protein
MSSLSLYRYGSGQHEKLIYFHNNQLYSADNLIIIRNLNAYEVMQHAVSIFSVNDFLNDNSFKTTPWYVPIFISTYENEYLIVSMNHGSDNGKIHVLLSSCPEAINQKIFHIELCLIPDVNRIKENEQYWDLPSYNLVSGIHLFRYILSKIHLNSSLAMLLPNIEKDSPIYCEVV